MSCKTSILALTEDMRQRIDKDLRIKLEDSKYSMGQARYIFPHTVVGNDVYLPFAYAYRHLRLERPLRINFPIMNVRFGGNLYEEQVVVRKEAISRLNKTGSILLALSTGYGKTITSINLACSIKLKTLVVVNKIILMKQWERSIEIFCPDARIQLLTPKSTMKDCDFYIMNAINIPKMRRSFFKDIGLCIVDEAHLIMAEILSECMRMVTPRYLIGLSATPYRNDGLDVLLELYFGKYKIIRKLWREHTAFRVNTGFEPTMELAANGRVNWGTVLDSQAKDHDRNEIVIKIVKTFPERVFLILTKRVGQGRHLVNRLEEENEYVTSLIGQNQEFDREARILVGTIQKVSVGFEHNRLNAMILAADVKEYYIQVLGRVFRTKEVEPIVFDMVDNNPILKRHFQVRKGVYIEHGGAVKNFKVQV